MSDPHIDYDLTERLHAGLKSELQAAKDQIVKLSLEVSQLRESNKELMMSRPTEPNPHFSDCNQEKVLCMCVMRSFRQDVASKERECVRLREQLMKCQDERDVARFKLSHVVSEAR